MKYMGSKNRVAAEILPIILQGRTKSQWYVEPFVGGGNMIDKVEGLRIGADFNEHVIQALRLIRDQVHTLPQNNTEFCEADYRLVKRLSKHCLKGYIGFTLSYSGKWFGGWCRDGERKRDYVREAYRNAVKQSPKLQGVKLFQCSYTDLPLPPESIIYCDPPYAETTGYKDKFNSTSFWTWCANMAKRGHKVFVSEYSAPAGWRCVWKKELVSSLTKDTGSKIGIEKLFIYEGTML